MCFTDLTDDGVPDVLLVSPGHRNGKVISYDANKHQYRMLKLVVVPDEAKKFRSDSLKGRIKTFLSELIACLTLLALFCIWTLI